MDSAEQAALSHKLDVGTSVRYYNARRLNEFGPDGRLQDGSKEMNLAQNGHFDHLAVNTSLSSVLLPAGVRDSGDCMRQYAAILTSFCTAIACTHTYTPAWF
jgi:hypothetical protein